MTKAGLVSLAAGGFVLLGGAFLWGAETPGLIEGKKYLIIHADDAGMSHSANAGTIDGMSKGIISSTSIMVPCPWFVEFANYARQHPEMDFGVHLTLNCEWKNYRWGPVAPRDKVPSLVDEQGYLWDNVRQVAEHAKTEEVEIELRAQIARAKEFDIPLSHIDTHMGAVVARPDLVAVYVKLGMEYDLPVLFPLDSAGELAREHPALAQTGKALVAMLRGRGFPIVDRLAQFYEGETHAERKENYLKLLRDLRPGVTQLIVHCGYDDEELRAITNSAARRDSDRRVFTDPDVITEVKRRGIEVIGWRQLREMTKQGAAGSK